MLFATITTYSTPIYLPVRFAVKAKWQIVIGNCQDGRGICMAINPNLDSKTVELGYDDTNNQVFYLKIERECNEGKIFASGRFEIQEDSPIDPKLISSFQNFKIQNGKFVVIKKGIYSVKTVGSCYIIELKYYIQ
jgi:hypothetical protein